MDILSLAVGFVVGSLTGAAGTYLGNKYTDKRRLLESAKQENYQWDEFLKKFPEIAKEMMDDVSKPDFTGVRIFFVKNSKTIVNKSEPSFEYYTDVHPNLNAAIMYLADLGYIEDITPGNCPMYRFYEHFYDRLKKG